MTRPNASWHCCYCAKCQEGEECKDHHCTSRGECECDNCGIPIIPEKGIYNEPNFDPSFSLSDLETIDRNDSIDYFPDEEEDENG